MIGKMIEMGLSWVVSNSWTPPIPCHGDTIMMSHPSWDKWTRQRHGTFEALITSDNDTSEHCRTLIISNWLCSCYISGIIGSVHDIMIIISRKINTRSDFCRIDDSDTLSIPLEYTIYVWTKFQWQSKIVLTHICLVTPYGDIETDQQWLIVSLLNYQW